MFAFVLRPAAISYHLTSSRFILLASMLMKGMIMTALLQTKVVMFLKAHCKLACISASKR